MQSTLFRRAVTALSMLLVSGYSAASDWTERSDINLRPGVTEISNEVYLLHNIVLWVCCVIGLLVLGLVVYSSIQHRRSKRPEASHFHENLFLEVFWTIIPFFILIALAIPATRVLVKMDDTSEAELTVKVTGYRWNWSYEYIAYADDNNVGVFFFSNLKTPAEQYNTPIFSSGLFPYGTAADRFGAEPVEKDFNYMLDVDRPLVIPAGVKVRILITADDVIHSFYMPDFAIKKDAIPGFINEVWTLVPEDQTGVYFGQCAELCGKNHAFMPIQVNVVPQAEFDVWLADEKEKAASGPDLTPFKDLADAMKLGQERYNSSCALCHGANGQGGIGLPFAGTDLMKNHERLEENIHVVRDGRNAMPAFSAQLTPRDIAAVVTYQRNAFGNETGDLVQPADIVK